MIISAPPLRLPGHPERRAPQGSPLLLPSPSTWGSPPASGGPLPPCASSPNSSASSVGYLLIQGLSRPPQPLALKEMELTETMKTMVSFSPVKSPLQIPSAVIPEHSLTSRVFGDTCLEHSSGLSVAQQSPARPPEPPDLEPLNVPRLLEGGAGGCTEVGRRVSFCGLPWSKEAGDMAVNPRFSGVKLL